MNPLVVKLLVLLAFACAASAATLHETSPPIGPLIAINSTLPLPGGVNRHAQLPPNVDAFVRRQKPELRGARVLTVTSQVVAGTKYSIVYGNDITKTRWNVEVLSQPWLRTLKLLSFTRHMIYR